MWLVIMFVMCIITFSFLQNIVVRADVIDESAIGGNASAEDPTEAGAMDDSTKSGVDIVLRHRLMETGFSKKKEYQLNVKVSYEEKKAE